MADQLITGTTLVEKESRSIGDVPVGGIVEWNETQAGVGNLPEGFVKATGQTIADATSPLNGQTITDFNTHYKSLAPSTFISQTETDDVTYLNTYLNVTTGAVTFNAPIELPTGAIVTEVIVYGNTGATDETWLMLEIDRTFGGVTMATAVVGTADTSITNPTIDNDTKSYGFQVNTLETDDRLYGARITYTSPLNKQVLMRIK